MKTNPWSWFLTLFVVIGGAVVTISFSAGQSPGTPERPNMVGRYGPWLADQMASGRTLGIGVKLAESACLSVSPLWI